jgi:hypothetical protein
VNLEVGGQQQFTATGYDANNNQVPITDPQWSTSGGGTLTPNGTTCTDTAGTTPGHFTVTCQQGGTAIQDTANVQVYQGKAKLISPAGGTTFGNGTATFTWLGNSGVTRFALWVGSSPNSHDLYARVETGLSRTLALPTDGRPIYVTLWAWFNNAWERGDALLYTAATAAKARMLSPTNPSTLPSGTPTFIWDTGVGVTLYALWVGNGPRTYDIFAAYQSDLSETVRLPTDGRTIYVTLWSLINGAWQANDYTYTAYTAPRTASQMLSPTNGATLPGGPTTFIWDTGASVTQRALWVGNNPVTHDLYAVFETGLSRTVTLPTDGRTIYVTLWSLIRSTWLPAYYQYTCDGGAAPGPTPSQMLSPANGTTLSGATTTFIWDTGSGVTLYALWVGSAANTHDLYAGLQSDLSETVRLPTDGRTLHVTLWSLINGAWQSSAYTYTAYTGGPAKMLSPANTTTLTSAVTTFIWDTGVGVAQRALWVGSNPNTHDLYAAFEPGQSRTLWLPVDGRTLYVTLWSWMNGSWQSNAYTYQAFGP